MEEQDLSGGTEQLLIFHPIIFHRWLFRGALGVVAMFV
jgi:hypothetical protein